MYDFCRYMFVFLSYIINAFLHNMHFSTEAGRVQPFHIWPHYVHPLLAHPTVTYDRYAIKLEKSILTEKIWPQKVVLRTVCISTKNILLFVVAKLVINKMVRYFWNFFILLYIMNCNIARISRWRSNFKSYQTTYSFAKVTGWPAN